MNNKQIVRLYMHKIKNQIRISLPAKKHFFQTLKQNIVLFLEEHPNASYEEILSAFGSPEEVAASFYETIDSSEIDQQLHRKHRLLIYCCTAIASLLLLCSWYSQKSSQAIVLYEFVEIQANDNIHK